MRMSGEIRVRTSRYHKVLYSEMKNFVFKDAHEFFFTCACLGYKAGQRKPLAGKGDDRFWSNTFTPDEYASFYAMAIESNEMNLESVTDDQKVIHIMEEYANAGIGILIDGVLSNYTLKDGNEVRLDTSLSKELPKIILGYILEQIMN